MFLGARSRRKTHCRYPAPSIWPKPVIEIGQRIDGRRVAKATPADTTPAPTAIISLTFPLSGSMPNILQHGAGHRINPSCRDRTTPIFLPLKLAVALDRGISGLTVMSHL